MIRSSPFLIVCILLTFLFCSCSQKRSSTPTEPEPQVPDPSTYFPHNYGSYWIYSVGDVPRYKLKLTNAYDHPQAGETQKLEIYVDNGSGWALDHVYYQKVTETDVRIYQYTGSFLLANVSYAA